MNHKRCTRCKQLKSTADFYKNKNNSWCISCYREVTLANYHSNPKSYMDRQRTRRRNNPDVCNSYRKRHPEKYKAHTALSNAVRDGKIEKPTKCEKCQSAGLKIHGHHWHGYDKLHWLDVQWLCPICHKAADR